MTGKPSAPVFARLNFFSGALLGCGRIGCVYGLCAFLVWPSSRNAALALAYLTVGWACCFCARKLRLFVERAADDSAGWLVNKADEREQWRANGIRAAGGLLSATLLAAALPGVSQDVGFGLFSIALAGVLISLSLAARSCADQAETPARPDWLGHWAVVRLPLARPHEWAGRGAVRLLAAALAYGALAAMCAGAFVAAASFASMSFLSLFGAV